MMRWVCWGCAFVALVAVADDVRFERDVDAWWHSDVAPAFSTLERAVGRHLRDPEDFDAFWRATRTSVDDLLAGVRAHARNASRSGGSHLPNEALPVVLSTKKLVPHPLNARGLHALRALVAARVMHDIVATEAAADDWPARLLRDGYVAEPFDAANRTAVFGSLSALFRRDFSRAADGEAWERFAAAPDDKQLYLHVDTYLPTFKVWLFKGVREDEGPLLFVRGSHAPSEAKLRWLFERTRHLTSPAALPPPSPETYAASGPFDERTFGFEASLRFEGVDPRANRIFHPTSMGA
jgi:hypothetical protein